MKFSRKVFIAVFLAALVVGTGLIWASYQYVAVQNRESFIARYTAFSKVLGDTLTRLDLNTEALMHNAAQLVEARDFENGLLSTEKLKDLRDSLNVTHIFVVNKKGDFIRSTNEDPKLIPNAYSFCSDYQNMVIGQDNVAATPIIHPQPEPKPYKFLFVPNRNRDRLIEVGVRVDFIAKTLIEALGSDENVLNMSVYDPKGASFGSFKSNSYDFSESQITLPDTYPYFSEEKDVFKFYTKVKASHTQCCQCDVAGTSINGEYYYVLESVISKKALAAVLARTKTTFFIFALTIILVAFIFGYYVSRRLVQNIELAADRVRKIKEQNTFKDRIQLEGEDEVAFLTNEFDNLLDNLEESKKKVVEAEKVEAKVQLAKEVAHNMKSPLHAIEIMLQTMFTTPQKVKDVLHSSVTDIRCLLEKLNEQADSMFTMQGGVASTDLVFLPKMLEDLVYQKQVEYSDRGGIEIKFNCSGDAKDAFVRLSALELKSILSNLINNAVESYGASFGRVEVTLSAADGSCVISVADQGAGIPKEFLTDLGSKRITFKGDIGRGVGLLHAFKTVESWGGKVEIESEMGKGTTIHVNIPMAYSQREPTRSEVATI